MAITYSAGTGTTITTHAMDETCINQTDQTGNNTIIVSDDLSTAGNGQIGSGSNGIGNSYVGRLVVVDLGLSTEQRRFCIAETDLAAGGTVANSFRLTVHEDWTTNPVVTTDTVHVPYEAADIEDGGVSSGVTYTTRTGIFTFTNDIIIASGGGLQIASGTGWELDDTGTSVTFFHQSGGYFYSGFESGGSYINGGQILSVNNSTGEPAIQRQSGALGYVYDCLFWAQLVDMQYEHANGAGLEYYRSKWLNQTDELHLFDATVVDCAAIGKGATTSIVRVDAGTVCNGFAVSTVDTLETASGDTTTETITLKDVIFTDVTDLITLVNNKTWRMINPSWTLTSHSDVNSAAVTGTAAVYEETEVNAVIQEADNTLLENALLNIYEHDQTVGLDLELTTDVNGEVNDSFKYLDMTWTTGTGATTTYGGHARQAGKWLYLPQVFAQSTTEKFDGAIVLGPDNNIVQTTQATAITAGSGITWTEPTNTTEIVAFTSGSGTLAVGMILTFTPSGATGTIRESAKGDSTAGELYLDTRSATAIANGDTFSRTGGTAGTFSGTYTNDSKQPFTISINGNSLSLQTIYDYLAAVQQQTTRTTDSRAIWSWCRSAQSQPLYATGTSFYSEQSNSKGIYIYDVGAGTLDYLTDDSGTTWLPPTSTTFQVTVKNGTTALEGIAVRFEETDGTDISDGTTSALGIYNYADTLGNRTINCIVRKRGYKYQEFNIVVTGDFDIPVSFIRDPSVNRV